MEPVWLKTIDISRAGVRNKQLIGDLNGDGRMELLMVQADGGIDDRYVPHQVNCLTAFDLDGRLLWQTGTPDPNAGSAGSDYPAQLYDLDGDGQLEVLCVMDKKFKVLSGLTGEVKEEYELPDPQAHDCIIIANLSGAARAQDIILKDRYQRMWAMNRQWQLLWTHEGNLGHYPWVYDIDDDGRDEVMAGYDLLDHDGTIVWSCRELQDHADCVWVGDVNGDSRMELVIGGSVTVLYDAGGQELWRHDGSVESQHIALGKFRDDLPGLQIAGLDRIVRGDTGERFNLDGKDALYLLDNEGKQLWKEERTTSGWLTIIETLRGWDGGPLDYILAYRRGGGIHPALYDGQMNAVSTFPVDGYVTHADLTGSGLEQVLIYTDTEVHIYASCQMQLLACQAGRPLPQSKRLYSSTLYPGGEYR